MQEMAKTTQVEKTYDVKQIVLRFHHHVIDSSIGFTNDLTIFLW